MVCPEELSVDEPLFRSWRIQNRSSHGHPYDCLQSPVSVYSTVYSSLQTLRPSVGSFSLKERLLLYLQWWSLSTCEWELLCTQKRELEYNTKRSYSSFLHGSGQCLEAAWTRSSLMTAAGTAHTLFPHKIFKETASRDGDRLHLQRTSYETKQLSGFESRYLQKIQNGRHKQRNEQHTLARQKIYKKNKSKRWRLRSPLIVWLN